MMSVLDLAPLRFDSALFGLDYPANKPSEQAKCCRSGSLIRGYDDALYKGSGISIHTHEHPGLLCEKVQRLLKMSRSD